METKTAVTPRCPFCQSLLDEVPLASDLELRRCGCGHYVLLLWSPGRSRILEAIPAPAAALPALGRF